MAIKVQFFKFGKWKIIKLDFVCFISLVIVKTKETIFKPKVRFELKKIDNQGQMIKTKGNASRTEEVYNSNQILYSY